MAPFSNLISSSFQIFIICTWAFKYYTIASFAIKTNFKLYPKKGHRNSMLDKKIKAMYLIQYEEGYNLDMIQCAQKGWHFLA